MRAISRSLWIRNIVRNGFLNFQPSTQNMQAILVRTNTTASMNATSSDSLSNDNYSAKLAMSHKGAMVVKNNLISFDLTKDFNDVDYLWITAVCYIFNNFDYLLLFSVLFKWLQGESLDSDERGGKEPIREVFKAKKSGDFESFIRRQQLYQDQFNKDTHWRYIRIPPSKGIIPKQSASEVAIC